MSNGLKSSRAHAITTFRPGEGVLVDMQMSSVTDVDGGGVAFMRGSFSNVPVPERRYSADICFVSYSDETVYVLFGQKRFDGEDLRNLLVVKMSPSAIRSYLDTLAPVENGQTISSLSETMGIYPEMLPKFQNEPKESITLTANIIMAAVSGREGCMDFYYASPFSKAAAAANKKLAVDPVVRIDIRTGLLLGMNSAMEEIIRPLPDSVVYEAGRPRTGGKI